MLCRNWGEFMAILNVPAQNLKISDFENIRAFLESRGVWHDRWKASAELADEASQEEILAAYQHVLGPFMAKGGYQTADVINVNQKTPDLPSLRAKFLAEHTHSEDEVRFFVDGEGLFWFNIEGEVFSLLCQAGDLISVPAHTAHWFDLGPKAFVKAIRVFIDKAGWVPHYTGSGIDQNYNPRY